MKKIIPIILLVVIFAVSVPFINDFSAKNVENSLLEIALPENTQMVESVSKAGKLVGNGNGMQYFGAMLIKSEQTLEELTAYYADVDAEIVVKAQTSQEIACLEHEQLSFTAEITEEENYYIVYLFGEGLAPFSQLDLRGH